MCPLTSPLETTSGAAARRSCGREAVVIVARRTVAGTYCSTDAAWLAVPSRRQCNVDPLHLDRPSLLSLVAGLHSRLFARLLVCTVASYDSR